MQAQGNPRAERAVLGFVLYEHPTAVTLGDLVREVGPDAAQTIADLAAVGLLQLDGEAVRPTPAAIRFDALEGS